MKRGFTLIELMVVISIIGMLASIVLAALSGTRQKAVTAANQSLDSNIYDAQGDSIALDLQFQDCAAGCTTTAVDASPYGNNATFNPGGHVTRVSPSYSGSGVAVSFDGNDAGFLSVPSSASFEPTSGITLSAWFEPTGISNGAEQHLMSTTQGGGWLLGFTGSGTNSGCPTFSLCFFFFNPAIATYDVLAYPTTSIQNGKWYFVAASYDGTTAKMYLNGQVVATLTQAGSIQYPAFPVPLCIGNEAINSTCSGNAFYGMMDSVRIYTRPITAEAIHQEYIAEAPEHAGGMAMK